MTEPLGAGSPHGTNGTYSPMQVIAREFRVDRERGALSPVPRSNLHSPPIGSKTTAWGRYATVPEILARPQPAPPIHLAQRRTLALQGGRWSRYEPVNELYLISRVADSSPGPGAYGPTGSPDPVLSTRTNPFGKTAGGRFSVSRRTTASDEMEHVGRTVPGPGAYDIDHIHGIAKRILNASSPSPNGQHRPFHTHLAQWEEDEFDGRARKPFARVNSPVRLLAQSPGERSHTSSWDEMASTGGGGGGQISMEQQISTIEQGLVMSRRVPLGKVCRLGTTRYSRLRKDTLASPVRRFRRETPIPSLDQEVQFAE